ncbi:uncharacterized protein LOC113859952 [Abrus precatorius]|uniref:Uncharacterized protein LOC113859952 n=1 Tax=Abrus precatorius TaxID=3816 RepID=A0A8B8KWW7_ABRPR|nr:uncharacterized protein LOC113859952 [Abrus precatorius]
MRSHMHVMPRLSRADERGLYPKGSPSRNSRRPEPNSGLRGGLEIVFNQQ